MIDIKDFRTAEHDIDPIYINRWSPRSFLDKEVPQEVLNSLFEAARWAPSAANVQPWRFIFARTEEDRHTFLSFIDEGNVIWCSKAPVLVAILSKTTRADGEKMNLTHAFDTGAAWAFLALEAIRQGLHTHPMGGFDRDKAKDVLNIPEEYDVQAIVAIGYMGPKENLTESLQEREKPSGRKGLDEIVAEGSFSFNK